MGDAEVRPRGRLDLKETRNGSAAASREARGGALTLSSDTSINDGKNRGLLSDPGERLGLGSPPWEGGGCPRAAGP
ncbi:hypothetical protein GCM10009783_46690 [Glycomyces lechevalierae]